jgi:hypothetical protein
MIGTQGNWGQPQRTHHTLATYMDMRQYIAINTVEEQAIWSWDLGNRGHAIRLTSFSDMTWSTLVKAGGRA